MTESHWVSAHIFYHGDLDLLLSDVVLPLVRQFDSSGLADEFFFLRYWDGGPHLRLRVRPAGGANRAETEQLIDTRFTEYLTRRPAPDLMPQAEYSRIAQTLAGFERVPSFAKRLRPNNSVAFIPYQREHDRYGGENTIAAVERHFTDSSRIALRVLTSGLPTGRVVSAAFAMVLLTWFIGAPDRMPDENLFRARESGFPGVTALPDDVEWRPDRVLEFARKMRALAKSADRSSGTLTDWVRSMAALRDKLTADESSLPPVRGWDGSRTVTSTDPAARTQIVMDICAHLLCNRLGVALPVEGALRRLAAETALALYQETE